MVILVLASPALSGSITLSTLQKAPTLPVRNLLFRSLQTQSNHPSSPIYLLTQPDDNSLAVIWSILEVSVAVICSCLPAIRALFSRWLPDLFDLNNPHEPASASSGTLSHPMQKIGPSYNKHYPILSNSSPTFSPLTSAFKLPPAPSHETETKTKIWINPKFDDAGQLVDFHSSELSPDYSQTPSQAQWDRRSSVPTESTSTSLWVLDGLRYSGEYGPNLDIAEPGVPMGNFLSAPGKVRFNQVQQKRPQ